MTFQQASTVADRLDGLEVGQRARVRAVDGRGSMTVRLLEMGFVPGVEVALIKRAPLGDPLELRLRGYHVSLRKAEARLVSIEAFADNEVQP
ncbi:MAG: ferrous iron transport protein A [Myxococcales bacterium]|nr:ferrous iron transport protein A [Myxococcales bacterium]